MDRFPAFSLTLPREERANALTHGLGVLLSLIGIPLLLQEGADDGELAHLAGVGVFCCSLLGVYLSSTIYHSVTSQRLKSLWHRIDHLSIYFLIAGTHTPFLLYFADSGMAHFYLTVIWSMVAAGVLFKLFFFGRFEWLSVLYYVVLGWMAVFTIPPMLPVMDDAVLFWIIAGGLSYTFGVIFFIWEKIPYHHAIWHLFVLGGSAGHFMAMFLTVRGA